VLRRLRTVKWLNGTVLSKDEESQALQVVTESKITHVSAIIATLFFSVCDTLLVE